VNWTVSRRIIAGFAIGAILVVVIAVVGVWALRQTASGYGAAVEAERQILLSAVNARGSVRNTNISYLRVLVETGPQFRQDFENYSQQSRTLLAALRDNEDVGARETWDEALRVFTDWDAAVREVMGLWQAGDEEGALEVRRDRVAPLRVELERVIETGMELAQHRTDESMRAAESTGDTSERAILLGLMLALLVFIVTAYLLNRAVSAPLEETSNVLASTAAEILSTTTEQATGATESLAAVTQTAATVDEVVQTAEQSAERARAVASSAQRAAEIGRDGRRAVETSIAAMGEVRDRVDDIGERIRVLADQAQAIGEIISTVNDLAEQTNLLALNAAIEAARAGEQGRGFAVVANEVKSLAEQSKAGTARVRQILEQIQRATTDAVGATDQGNRKVAEVTQQVTDAGETIRKLAESVAAAAQAAAQISASAGQQSMGMGQIRQAIGNIQQASQQNLAATRQAESAAQELNRIGSRLLDLVGTEAHTVRRSLD
jgi:methyl-accepting chemotaxis protein